MAERNVATVDLRKLIQNATAVKERAKTKLFAVVKANAYGHGAERVANALHAWVDGFCVALTEEGISLRYAGVNLPILVFSPPLSVEEAATCILHDLTVTVDGFPALQGVISAAERIGKEVSVHLKVNTGMNRFGISPQEVYALYRRAKSHPLCRVVGAYTHFAEVENEKATLDQYDLFMRATAPLKAAEPDILLHAGATGALQYQTRFSLDAVRVGLGLYGYGAEGVSPILSLHAPVLRTGTEKAGERLGYGKPLVAPCKYALTRFGYADGALRKGGPFTPHCMDVSFLQPVFSPTVEILGATRRADLVAKEEGTVPYEILCRYTARAEFAYLS